VSSAQMKGGRAWETRPFLRGGATKSVPAERSRDEDAASRERMGSQISVLPNRDSSGVQREQLDEAFDALAFATDAALSVRP
jgi:hypothetical protein